MSTILRAHEALERFRHRDKTQSLEPLAQVLASSLQELIDERHGPYPCCEHCVDDPDYHAANAKNSHDTSCTSCDNPPVDVSRDRTFFALAQALVTKTATQLHRPIQRGRWAEAGYNDHFNDGVDALEEALLEELVRQEKGPAR